MEVKDIIKEAITISEEASFTDAITLMIEKQTNSLLVTNQTGELIGEITVANLLEAIVPDYISGDSIAAHFVSNDMFDEAVQTATGKQVKYFMSKDITPINKDEGAMSVAVNAIAHKRVRIPVVDADNKPVGIISRRGLKHIIGDALNIADSE